MSSSEDEDRSSSGEAPVVVETKKNVKKVSAAPKGLPTAGTSGEETKTKESGPNKRVAFLVGKSVHLLIPGLDPPTSKKSPSWKDYNNFLTELDKRLQGKNVEKLWRRDGNKFTPINGEVPEDTYVIQSWIEALVLIVKTAYKVFNPVRVTGTAISFAYIDKDDRDIQSGLIVANDSRARDYKVQVTYLGYRNNDVNRAEFDIEGVGETLWTVSGNKYIPGPGLNK